MTSFGAQVVDKPGYNPSYTIILIIFQIISKYSDSRANSQLELTIRATRSSPGPLLFIVIILKKLSITTKATEHATQSD